MDEREEGWGDVERRFGAVEPWSLSCLRMFFIGLCSGAISGRSVWQGNLVLLFLTLLFDACCEGWGFEKILLRFALTSLVFVASYARLPPGSRFHLKHQHLHVPWQRAIQGFCGYNQALGDVATASGPPLHPHRLLVWEMKLHVQEAAE